MKIGECVLVKAGSNFASIDWQDAANIMSAKIIAKTDKQVTMSLKNAIYHFHDNGGEINITKEVAVRNYSVPYTDQNDDTIDAKTLGYRLITAVEGKKIDFNFKV